MELLAFGAIGLAIYALARLSALEKKVDQLQQGKQRPMQPEASSFDPATPPQPLHAPVAQSATELAYLQKHNLAPDVPPATVPQTPYEEGPFMTWLKQDPLMKIGALLLLIAFGWFVSYAFANNWIGPMGRITLGLLAGVGIMALGVWRERAYPHQGAVFTVLGSSAVLLTVFAAREIYDFFTPLTALGVMFLSIVFVAAQAVRQRSQNLALAGLTLGAIAPLLTNTSPDVVGIFSYLLILVLGSLWVMRSIGAVVLPAAAFVIVALYGSPYLGGGHTDPETSLALLFAFIFAAIFFMSNVVSILARQDAAARQSQIFLAASTGLYLVVWVYAAADPVWHSLLYAVWMIVFATGAFMVYLRTQERIPFYIYGAVSVGLLGAATAAELSGPLLTIAFAIQIAALIAVSNVLFQERTVVSSISLLYAVPLLLGVGHILSPAWRDGFLHGDFFALMVTLLSLLISAIILSDSGSADATEDANTSVVLLTVSGILSVVLVWLVTHSLFSDDVATFIALCTYTISGLVLFVTGHASGNQFQKIAGGILIGLVIARLLLVDVWTMELVGRIITFFSIGILLMSTAFMQKLNKRTNV